MAFNFCYDKNIIKICIKKVTNIMQSNLYSDVCMQYNKQKGSSRKDYRFTVVIKCSMFLDTERVYVKICGSCFVYLLNKTKKYAKKGVLEIFFHVFYVTSRKCARRIHLRLLTWFCSCSD